MKFLLFFQLISTSFVYVYRRGAFNMDSSEAYTEETETYDHSDVGTMDTGNVSIFCV